MNITKLQKNTTHLADVIGEITEIYICDDVVRFPREPFDQRYEPEDSEYTEEVSAAYFAKDLVMCSDDQLSYMSDDEIHNVRDGELLHRLNNIYPNKLTPYQKHLLRQHYEDYRFIVDKHDVEVFLSKLKRCRKVKYDRKHDKTNEFINDRGGLVRKADCLKVINDLVVGDYTYNMHSANPRYFGDDLMIFQPSVDWTMKDGSVVNKLCLYVKLDINRTTNTSCVIISFHRAEHENQPHPYK